MALYGKPRLEQRVWHSAGGPEALAFADKSHPADHDQELLGPSNHPHCRQDPQALQIEMSQPYNASSNSPLTQREEDHVLKPGFHHDTLYPETSRCRSDTSQICAHTTVP